MQLGSTDVGPPKNYIFSLVFQRDVYFHWLYIQGDVDLSFHWSLKRYTFSLVFKSDISFHWSSKEIYNFIFLSKRYIFL